MDIGQADMAGALIWLCAGHSAAVIFDDEKDFVLLTGDKDGKQTILFCLAETVEDRVFYQGLKDELGNQGILQVFVDVHPGAEQVIIAF